MTVKKIVKVTAAALLAGSYWHKLARPLCGNPALFAHQTPTLFIAGYAGNRLSFGRMIARMHKHHQGIKSATIIVLRDGRLKIYGNPRLDGGLIQVLFENNIAKVKKQINWLWQILFCLKNEISRQWSKFGCAFDGRRNGAWLFKPF